jgi:hypothetical protein
MFKELFVFHTAHAPLQILERFLVRIDHCVYESTNWSIYWYVIYYPTSTSFLIKLVMENCVPWIKEVTLALVARKRLLNWIKEQ